jgi:hypothetical protein
MHREQYSTVNQPTFGLMLSPQRGQLRKREARSIIGAS